MYYVLVCTIRNLVMLRRFLIFSWLTSLVIRARYITYSGKKGNRFLFESTGVHIGKGYCLQK